MRKELGKTSAPIEKGRSLTITYIPAQKKEQNNSQRNTLNRDPAIWLKKIILEGTP